MNFKTGQVAAAEPNFAPWEVTLASVTAGNTLILGTLIAPETAVVTGITDTKSNSWSSIQTKAGTVRNGALWRASSVAAGSTTITAGVTGTPDNVHFIVAEYESAVATENSKSAVGTGASPSSGSLATVNAGLAIGLIESEFTGYTKTPGLGWTERGAGSGSDKRVMLMDRVTLAVTSYTADASLDLGGDDWIAMIALFASAVVTVTPALIVIRKA